jgi:alkanesulfonate monooxygenase SsuD/methylene tetrahydromethanopterin reductase-like flavin-dependent oxidoreductase (luciferase family)
VLAHIGSPAATTLTHRSGRVKRAPGLGTVEVSSILARNCAAIDRDPPETDARANALAERLQASLNTKLIPDKNLVVGNPDVCAAWLGDFLHLGVTDVNVRMAAGPIGPQLAENFITLVGPRLREIKADVGRGGEQVLPFHRAGATFVVL